MYPYSNPYAYYPTNAAQAYQPAQPQQPQQPHAVVPVPQQHYAYAQQHQHQQQQPLHYASWPQAAPAPYTPMQYPNYQAYPTAVPAAAPMMHQPSIIPRTTVPPPTYICHRCRQRGHWITDCPMQSAQASQAAQQQKPPPPTAPPPAMPKPTSAAATPASAAPAAATLTTFFCEPCEKEFTSASKYQAHRSSHERCRARDCNFEGSKKVVIAHFHAVHGKFKGSGYKMIDVEGQKFRVLLGTSPDEVKEWREQRRKKFPTKENVQQKDAGRQALVEAGGIVPPVKGKKRKLPTTTEADDGTTTGLHIEVDSTGNIEASAAKRAATEGPSSDQTPATASTTLAALSAYADASDGEEGEVHDDVMPASAIAVEADAGAPQPNVLGEEQNAAEEADTDMVSSPNKQDKTERQRKRRPCTYFLKGHCNKGDECPFNHDVERKVCKYFAQGHCRKGKRCPFAHERAAAGAEEKRVKKSMGLNLPLPMQNSKLYKALVQDQIVKEENILLQCLHYMVQRDFMKRPLPAEEMQILVEQAKAERLAAAEAQAKATRQSSARQLLASNQMDLAEVDPELARELEQDGLFDEEGASDKPSSNNTTPSKNASRGAFASDSELEDGEVSDSESEEEGEEDEEENNGEIVVESGDDDL